MFTQKGRGSPHQLRAFHIHAYEMHYLQSKTSTHALQMICSVVVWVTMVVFSTADAGITRGQRSDNTPNFMGLGSRIGH